MRSADHDAAMEQSRTAGAAKNAGGSGAGDERHVDLAMPGIVLATGFFLLLNNTIGLPQSADGIVIFTNALMAIPYALKVLENPMRDITARYSMLCQSLGIEGWSRLKVVELRALKRPLAQALAFACVLSIGDFGVVALFGNDDFRTAVLSLPANWLLSQPGRRGHRVNSAATLFSAVYRD